MMVSSYAGHVVRCDACRIALHMEQMQRGATLLAENEGTVVVCCHIELSMTIVKDVAYCIGCTAPRQLQLCSFVVIYAFIDSGIHPESVFRIYVQTQMSFRGCHGNR